MKYVFLQYANGQVAGVYGSVKRAQAAVLSFLSIAQGNMEIAIRDRSEWMEGKFEGNRAWKMVVKAQDLDTQARFDIVYEIVKEKVL